MEGQGLAVVPQGMLLQLADGHGGERAGRALVRVLLACSKKNKSLDLTIKGEKRLKYKKTCKDKAFF